MERKEHPVATISAGGNVLKLLDPDGNPYTPSEPVDYQILDEDGEVLKEGTIKDTDEIPLDDVSTKTFRVMIDSHLVLDTQGFESPGEDEDHKILEGPTFDPEDSALSGDFTDVGNDDSEKDDETDSENSNDSSDDDSKGGGQETSDEGSTNSAESGENEGDQSDDEESKEDEDKQSSDDKKNDESASNEESDTSDDSQSDSEESDNAESDSNSKAKDDSD